MIPACSWIFSILGFVVMYVVLLANSMNTVPVKLSQVVAYGLVLLPLLACVVSLYGFHRHFSLHEYYRGLFFYTIPLLLALATCVLVILEYNPFWIRELSRLDQQHSFEAFSVDGSKPNFSLEIRLAHDSPDLGLTQMTSAPGKDAVFVSGDILFTNKDVSGTWIKSLNLTKEFQVGIKFSNKAQNRVAELSNQHIGKRWAILLNGDLFAAPKIVAPFQAEVVLNGDFTQEQARNFARGIVKYF